MFNFLICCILKWTFEICLLNQIHIQMTQMKNIARQSFVKAKKMFCKLNNFSLFHFVHYYFSFKCNWCFLTSRLLSLSLFSPFFSFSISKSLAHWNISIGQLNTWTVWTGELFAFTRSDPLILLCHFFFPAAECRVQSSVIPHRSSSASFSTTITLLTALHSDDHIWPHSQVLTEMIVLASSSSLPFPSLSLSLSAHSVHWSEGLCVGLIDWIEESKWNKNYHRHHHRLCWVQLKSFSRCSLLSSSFYSSSFLTCTQNSCQWWWAELVCVCTAFIFFQTSSFFPLFL